MIKCIPGTPLSKQMANICIIPHKVVNINAYIRRRWLRVFFVTESPNGRGGTGEPTLTLLKICVFVVVAFFFAKKTRLVMSSFQNVLRFCPLICEAFLLPNYDVM